METDTDFTPNSVIGSSVHDATVEKCAAFLARLAMDTNTSTDAGIYYLRAANKLRALKTAPDASDGYGPFNQAARAMQRVHGASGTEEAIEATLAATIRALKTGATGAGDWRDIASGPRPSQWLTNRGQFLLASIHVPQDEDGNKGAPEIVWAHVGYLTSNGWMLGTRGIEGTHGYASFKLTNPTHYMPLCMPSHQHRCLKI